MLERSTRTGSSTLIRRKFVSVCRATAFLFALACEPAGEVANDKPPEATRAPLLPAASAVATTCYVDGQSILARRPNSPAPGPADLRGWLELEGLGVADVGPAQLIDSDGASLGASWRRGDADSTLVEAFDDFIQVELRLALSDSGAGGSAVATSDAALEYSPDGAARDFRREWRVAARRASCDSLPAPGEPR